MGLTTRQQIIRQAIVHAGQDDRLWVENSVGVRNALDADGIPYQEKGGLLYVAAGADLLAIAIDQAVYDSQLAGGKAIFKGERTNLSAELAGRIVNLSDKAATATADQTAIDGQTL